MFRKCGFPLLAEFGVAFDGMRGFLCGLDHLAVACCAFAPGSFVEMIVIEFVDLAALGIVVDAGIFVSAADEPCAVLLRYFTTDVRRIQVFSPIFS